MTEVSLNGQDFYSIIYNIPSEMIQMPSINILIFRHLEVQQTSDYPNCPLTESLQPRNAYAKQTLFDFSGKVLESVNL
jgi:hypothetical protein